MTDELFSTPQPDLEEVHVLEEVRAAQSRLAGLSRAPHRWTGGLRRTAQARAIQGSNTIEGYTVSDDDAMAAVNEEEPLTADQRTWAEILGYRRVMTYILQLASDPTFRVDAQGLRSMHFMLLEHDLSKGPGQFRGGPIYVQRESDGGTVYEGPPAGTVPGLVERLGAALTDTDAEPMIRAAMAHLNLVMIHPFRDGNGRMARALQTLVLAQSRVLDPTFSSVEEWLGHNTQDYYAVLAATGQGAWHPENDARLWVKFTLRAHHMQGQTMVRRAVEGEAIGTAILEQIGELGIDERLFDPLFDAAIGARVRRPTYVKRSGVEERTATRDLKALVDLGLLEPRGATRGRYYVAAEALRDLRAEQVGVRQRLTDPYPWLVDVIRRKAAESR